jgi:hypothetical protein
MEYFSKTREQLISICKDKEIGGYSGLLKHEILLLVLEDHDGKPRFFTRTRDQLIAYCQTNGIRYYSGKREMRFYSSSSRITTTKFGKQKPEQEFAQPEDDYIEYEIYTSNASTKKNQIKIFRIAFVKYKFIFSNYILNYIRLVQKHLFILDAWLPRPRIHRHLCREDQGRTILPV